MTISNLIDKDIAERANTTLQWLGSDNLENYNESIKNGIKPKYGIGTIGYKFNNHGFRCDDFDLPSELPIVFFGCSITEGIGIHQYETWSYLLLEKIRKKTNKNIPYWNMGLGGTGIDTQARNLYFLTSILNIKINFAFSLLPHSCRREYKLESNRYRYWMPNPESEYKSINDNCSDPYFSSHQSDRSLMLIDSIYRQNNTKSVCSTWDIYADITKINKTFPLMNAFKLKMIPGVTERARYPCFARDGLHPGSKAHQVIANEYWQQVEKYF